MMHANRVKLTVGAMAALWLLCWIGISPAATPTPTKRVRILFADFSERMGLFFVAKDQRFFEEQGLDADLVQVQQRGRWRWRRWPPTKPSFTPCRPPVPP